MDEIKRFQKMMVWTGIMTILVMAYLFTGEIGHIIVATGMLIIGLIYPI